MRGLRAASRWAVRESSRNRGGHNAGSEQPRPLANRGAFAYAELEVEHVSVGNRLRHLFEYVFARAEPDLRPESMGTQAPAHVQVVEDPLNS